MAQINAREHVEWMVREGHMHAVELLDALDAADDVYAVAEEFCQCESLQDEARRLVTFEHRVRQLLIDWGAVDASDPSPPDPIAVLRMLLG